MFTRIATVSSTFNGMMVTMLYLSTSQLLFLADTYKHLAAKIVTFILMIGVFGFGYLMSTIGIIGLGFIVAEIESDRVIHLDDHILYRQYYQGNALTDYRGIEVIISKKVKWLPLLTYDVLSKEYQMKFNYKKEIELAAPKKGESVLFSADFPVKYNADKKQIILLDSVRNDTIQLK
ncbi:MAG: hypothetical protein JKY70_16760 [Mucilaginibacter sp.]|nr:hypothetical protein [Mucilaginibacter sp.]